ncbi:MAG: hypothetical protein KF760_33625 [Candidatus Eremiobacteraeota bacterium]|nr:hypothetical protein [Candidatus Eremiobacteraeota bacterium]MCW5869843.1 hypothetical protein [Candidatus Eremiobacteraeota bacterium]
MTNLSNEIPINIQRTPCADKNDRLGWKAGFSLEVEGISFGVRCNEPTFLPELRAFFPPQSQASERREVQVLLSFLKGGKTARKGVVNYHLVYDAWNRAARTQDLREAMDAFRDTLHTRLALMSQDKVYVHASVLKWQGRGLVLLGAAPEVVEELVEDGAELLSRDYARINAADQVEAWSSAALKPDLVVTTKTGSRRSLTPLSGGATAMALAANSPGMHFQAPRFLNRLASFCQRTEGFQAVLRKRGDLRHLLKQ